MHTENATQDPKANPPKDPPPASETKRRSRSATNYRIVYFAVHAAAVGVEIGMLRGPDGDKPLIVGARSPELALVDTEVKQQLETIDGTIGKVVAIPDSAWHEFVPKAGWERL